MKNKDKKRKQHYIWKYYLKPWAKNEQICCLRNNDFFKTNLVNIGNIRDFYRLKELTLQDIELINKLSLDKITNPMLKKLNEGWILFFNRIFILKNKLLQNKMNKLIEVEIENLINNLEEDLHAKIERRSKQYIKKLRNEDTSFYYTNKGNLNFNYFLSVQYFRTNKIKTATLDVSKEFQKFDINKIWNVLSHIFSTNVGFSLYTERKIYKCILMKNNTSLPFITGDQPVINTYGNYKKVEFLNDHELELYYPITPKLSILITQKKEYENESVLYLKEAKIKYFNDLIFNASQEQIYGNEENVLKNYINTQ